MLGMPKNDFLTAPRGKLVAIVAILCVGIGLILIGVLSANHSGPAASRTADEPAVRAQLGHVSEPDAFREAYQVHLEHMVREQLQTFRAELDSRDKALEARGSAQMERFARLFNDWQARSDTVDRSRGATAAAPPVEPPKYVALHRYTD